MTKYLDSVGLTYLWGKITALLSTKADTADIPQYEICTLAEYNAMASHDANTYYIIIAEPDA